MLAGEWRYIVAAYAASWITLAGFAVYLARARRKAQALYDDAVSQSRGIQR